MSINAILAHDSDFGIGKNGTLPWPHNKTDMKWFRALTEGHVVVMGRKTWESIGSKNLPKRTNIVVSRGEVSGNPHSVYFGEMSRLIDMLKSEYPNLKIWFIGGADIYRQVIPLCDRVYVTKFPESYDCDTFINMDEYLLRFSEINREELNGLTFSLWSRN
jgi:dihydrofolate reductase